MRDRVIEIIEKFAAEVQNSSNHGHLTAEVYKDHLEDAADDIMEEVDA